MRQMEKSVRLRLAEKLDDKTEYSVAHHINGVDLSARSAFYYARADNRKQNDIKISSASLVGNRVPSRPGIGSPRQHPEITQFTRAHMTVKIIQGVKMSNTSRIGRFEIFAPSQYANGMKNTPPNRLILPKVSLLNPFSRKANAVTVNTP